MTGLLILTQVLATVTADTGRYLLQQQVEIFAASGLEPRAFELMHSRLATKLNGYVHTPGKLYFRSKSFE